MAKDPYETWLGIPAHRRPPTHYDLLGLVPFESDPQTIDQAALRRMGKVRQHQIGPHSDLSQEILAELARARLILMDRDRRADYDETLRARGASGQATRPSQNDGNCVTSLSPSGCGEDIPDVLGSLVVTEEHGDVPTSRGPISEIGESPRNKMLLYAAIGVSHVILFAAFYHYYFATPTPKAPSVANVRISPPLASPTPKSIQKIPVPPLVRGLDRREFPPQVVPKRSPGPNRNDLVKLTPANPPRKWSIPLAATENAPTDGATASLPPQPVPAASVVKPPVQTDPIADRLDKARKAYEDKLHKLRGQIAKALDRTMRDPRHRGNRRLSILINEERRLLDSVGQIPSCIQIDDYKKIFDVQFQYYQALDQIGRQYDRLGKSDAAREVDREQEELEKQMKAGKPLRVLESVVLLATGDMEQPSSWFYTTVNPGPNWLSFRYKPVGWSEGLAGFASLPQPGGLVVGTQCDGDFVWLRKEVNFPTRMPGDELWIRYRWDAREAKIYVNGRLLMELPPGWNTKYDDMRLEDAKLALFHPGINVLSGHYNDKNGRPSGIDVGLTFRRR